MMSTSDSIEPTDLPVEPSSANLARSKSYWIKSLVVVTVVLVIWASISLLGGIVLRDWLDATLPKVGGAPFGFWIAQQGAIIGFLALLVLYMVLMNRLDHQHGYADGDDE